MESWPTVLNGKFAPEAEMGLSESRAGPSRSSTDRPISGRRRGGSRVDGLGSEGERRGSKEGANMVDSVAEEIDLRGRTQPQELVLLMWSLGSTIDAERTARTGGGARGW